MPGAEALFPNGEPSALPALRDGPLRRSVDWLREVDPSGAGELDLIDGSFSGFCYVLGVASAALAVPLAPTAMPIRTFTNDPVSARALTAKEIGDLRNETKKALGSLENYVKKELASLTEQMRTLESERDDLIKAIEKLRQGIIDPGLDIELGADCPAQV